MLVTNFFRWALNAFLKRSSGDFNSFPSKIVFAHNNIGVLEVPNQLIHPLDINIRIDGEEDLDVEKEGEIDIDLEIE